MARRAAAAQKTLDAWSDRPLKLGTNDCVRMAASHLRLMGYKVKLPPAGSYRTIRGAKKALGERGYATLAEALDDMGLERIAPAAVTVGDLILMASADGLGGLGVALGNGRAVAYHDDAETAAIVQPHTCDGAWRT